jgi:asparagine synthase (glutamine-hydrolysing)
MPGLAGLLSRSSALDATVTVERMLGAAPHRAGLPSCHTIGRCTLGLLASDQAGDCAHLAVRADCACAFTGVLDNPEELWHLFQGQHVPADPAQVVLGIFRVRGLETFNLLRGEWAVAITDGHHLWCARDHFGLEPLFYRDHVRALYVASEAKQVIAGAGIPREPDIDVVDAILFSENTDRTPSALKGVERLPKATVLVADERSTRQQVYWDPEVLIESIDPTPDELKQRFDDLMTQAVRRTLTGSDIVTLSGGIDSPAVAAYAAPLHRELYGRPLQALSHVYPDFPVGDEREYIEMIVAALDIPVDMYQPQPLGLENLSHYVELFDGPWSAWVPQMAEETYQRAVQRGCSTILSGEFAELVYEMRTFLLAHLLQRGRLGAAARQLEAQRAAGESWAPLIRRVLTGFTPRLAAGLYYRYLSETRVPDWIDKARVAKHNQTLADPSFQVWRRQQVAGLNGPGLSAEASAILQAACGVRERMPWVDVDLFELFISLRAEVKFPDHVPKSLVRQLLRGRLPDAILDRRQKVGMHDYFRASFDYPALRKLLVNPQHRFAGVDYDRLALDLDRESLDEGHYFWAKDLAYAHAFLELW